MNRPQRSDVPEVISEFGRRATTAEARVNAFVALIGGAGLMSDGRGASPGLRETVIAGIWPHLDPVCCGDVMHLDSNRANTQDWTVRCRTCDRSAGVAEHKPHRTPAQIKPVTVDDLILARRRQWITGVEWWDERPPSRACEEPGHEPTAVCDGFPHDNRRRSRWVLTAPQVVVDLANAHRETPDITTLTVVTPRSSAHEVYHQECNYELSASAFPTRAHSDVVRTLVDRKRVDLRDDEVDMLEHTVALLVYRASPALQRNLPEDILNTVGRALDRCPE